MQSLKKRPQAEHTACDRDATGARFLAWAIVVLAAAAILAGCMSPAAVRGSSSPSDHVRDGDVVDQVARLDDGAWTMIVDRQWDRTSGRVGFPSDPLREEDYEPVADGPRYPVTVTWRANMITIGSSEIVGTRDTEHTDRYYFNLTEGVFAGGRFVVWLHDGGLQAELTIYGSGVPIISSERGPLVPVPGMRFSYLPVCTQ